MNEKSFSNVVTINGYLQDDSCISLIELPEIRDEWDIMASTQVVAHRCFDKVVVFLNLTQPIDNDYLSLIQHHIEFLEFVYGNKISNSLGLFAVSKAEDQDMQNVLQKFNNINVSLKLKACNSWSITCLTFFFRLSL